MLARMLFDPPNFLVLDEPTNHLDLATKEMLMKALESFEGTMLLVSHDRVFLRALLPRARAVRLGPHVYPVCYPEYVRESVHESPAWLARP